MASDGEAICRQRSASYTLPQAWTTLLYIKILFSWHGKPQPYSTWLHIGQYSRRCGDLAYDSRKWTMRFTSISGRNFLSLIPEKRSMRTRWRARKGKRSGGTLWWHTIRRWRIIILGLCWGLIPNSSTGRRKRYSVCEVRRVGRHPCWLHYSSYAYAVLCYRDCKVRSRRLIAVLV